MKKNKLFTALGLAGTLVIAGAAMAAGQNQHSADFETLDENKDGTLSYSEIRDDEMIQKNWETIDSDQDGAVDRIEFSAFEAEQNMETKQDGSADEPPKKIGDPVTEEAR